MAKDRKINQIIQELGKVPPSSIDLEETILGSLLTYPKFEFVYKTVSSKHFYREVNQQIFEAMEQLYKNKAPIDLMTVTEQLRSTDKLDMVGGPYFLSQLTNKAEVSTYSLDYNAKIIRQKFVQRELIRITSEIQEKSFDNTMDVDDLIQHFFSEVETLSHLNYIDYQKVVHYERIVLKRCILDNESLLTLYGNIPDYFFIDQIHQIIWNILTMLHDTEIPIAVDAVRDILEESENKKYVLYLQQFVEHDYGHEDDSFDYILTYLRKNYDRIQIFKLYRYLETARINSQPESIIEKIDSMLDNIRVKDLTIHNHKALLDSTLSEIITHHTDGNMSILKTGYPYMDRFCKFSQRNIVLLGGARGHGKTRFVLKTILGLLENNENIAGFLVTMEDPSSKVIKLFVASMTGLTVDQIDSKDDNKLTKEQRDSIKEAFKKIKEFDLEYIDEPVSVARAEAAFVKFKKKRPGKTIILLLDNIMILEDNDGTTKSEDAMARRFVAIAKKTNALFFILHHYTKAQMEKANVEEGYRPREEHLKGTTRFPDIAHYVLLMNNPKKYPDFMLLQKKKPMISYRGVKMTRETIFKELIIVEVSKHRDGSNDEGERLLRFYPADLGTMQINEWR